MCMYVSVCVCTCMCVCVGMSEQHTASLLVTITMVTSLNHHHGDHSKSSPWQPLTSMQCGPWTISPSSPPPDQARPGERRGQRSVPTRGRGWTWNALTSPPWLMSPWKPTVPSCCGGSRPHPLPVSWPDEGRTWLTAPHLWPPQLGTYHHQKQKEELGSEGWEE